ncbi:MAG: colanic acid biosynthesis glycosyltransferase WcaL [Calditrichaeota bacterium]|nr:MAG: colanic acid biosynthesis glycosyltransferase WcaL [Calditrichota bacterium]
MRKRMKIAYLVKMFPRFAETFILNELLELERQRGPLLLLSLRHPNEPFRQSQVQQIRSRVVYVPDLGRLLSFRLLSNLDAVLRVLRANLRIYRRNPERYRKAWRICWNLRDSKARKRFLAAGYIAELLLEQGIEHLHAHFANDPATVARFVYLLTGIPYSFTAHAKDIYLSNKALLRQKIHDAQFVVTCTEYNRKYLQEVSRNGTPIHTIYHGLDPSLFWQRQDDQLDKRKTSGGTSQVPLILSVGRLVEKKGFDVLLDACHVLKSWGVAYRCQIIGEGPLEMDLRERIHALGLQNEVELLPFIPQKVLVRKYVQADVFALSCRITSSGDRDGIPNVLLEAMALEVPVVATNVSGISELIREQQNGLLVPSENPVALAQALQAVLMQPHVFLKLGREGKRTVAQRFDLTRNVAQLTRLFQPN